MSSENPTGNAPRAPRHSGGAPKGNVNAVACGAYSKRLFFEDEGRPFEALLNQLNSDFPPATNLF